MSAPVAIRRQREPGLRLRTGLAPLLAAALASCAPQPEPRTVIDFMEDGLARDGVLTRCNQDRDATLTDEECANARRAAAAIALSAERARAPELEQESEAKLVALREREARRAEAEREALAAANAAADAAYESRWPDQPGTRPTEGTSSSPVPVFGTPVGPVLPSMSRAPAFDVYADGSNPLGRPSFEIADAEPPANELVIAQPQLEMTELAVVARPLQGDAPAR